MTAVHISPSPWIRTGQTWAVRAIATVVVIPPNLTFQFCRNALAEFPCAIERVLTHDVGRCQDVLFEVGRTPR